MRTTIIALAVLAMASVPAAGQAPTARVAATEVLDPARLTAARDLIDVVMPVDRREAMIEGMMKTMTANLQQSIGASEDMRKDARVKAIFDRYVADQTSESTRNFKVALPGMITAMSRAYARRFTVAQMAEMKAFFATPTGRLYMDQGATIMSDPDVASWQQATMSAQWSKMRDGVRAMQLEIMALPEKPE